jgi:hypothetical protein
MEETSLSFVKRLKAKKLGKGTLDANGSATSVPLTKSKAKNYSGKDLKNLKVGHSLTDLLVEEGQEDEHDSNFHSSSKDGGESSKILILKDSNILDDEDDELVNIQALAKEKSRLALESKRKAALGGAYEEGDEDNFTNAKGKSLLSHYDDEKTEVFRVLKYYLLVGY